MPEVGFGTGAARGLLTGWVDRPGDTVRVCGYDAWGREVNSVLSTQGAVLRAQTAYDRAGAPLSVQRSGVVDVAVGAEAAETFGTLDHLTYTWDGARLQSVESESHGSDYLGRPGYATSWYGDVTAYEWNAAGQLTKDASRGISRISYAACGLPQQVTLTNGDYVGYVRATDGTLLGVSTYQKLGGRRAVRTARRVYVGDWELDADTVSLVRCPWGWIDAAGRASYEHRDTRGSVTMVTDHRGSEAMHTGYYPDGEPWRTPAGRSHQLEGKERLTALGLNEYLYPDRHYTASTTLFTTPDPLAADFGWLNPYTYCAANPNRFTDPTGEELHADKESQNRIKQGFPKEVQPYIEFDKNGLLNAKRLNECKVKSANLQDLKLLANSAEMVYVRTSHVAVAKNENIQMGDNTDNNRKGITLTPNVKNSESPDGDIHVYSSSKLTGEKTVTNMAHELYGHASFYLQGKPTVHKYDCTESAIIDGEYTLIH